MKKYSKWAALALLIIFIAIISYYIITIIKFGKDIGDGDVDGLPHDGDPANQTEQPEPPPEWTGKDRVNIAIFGIDARGADKNGRTRSDTIMVISIDPSTKQAHLFSILRDTYVSIPGYGQERINAAYAFGGANLAMKTVGEFLDLPIHYYVSLDFEGFIKLVDALGGIEFEVEKNMTYTDPTDDPAYNIDLKAGLQLLDGNKALQYVRFRQDRLSDYSRTERQRNIIKAVAKEMLTLTSLLKLPSTLEKVQPYIKTNMSLNEMWALGNLAYKINAQNMTSEQLPPMSLLREETINGASVITTDPVKLRAYVQSLFEQQDEGANGGASDAGG